MHMECIHVGSGAFARGIAELLSPFEHFQRPGPRCAYENKLLLSIPKHQIAHLLVGIDGYDRMPRSRAAIHALVSLFWLCVR